MRLLIFILILLAAAFSGNSCGNKSKTSQDGDSAEFKRPGPVPAPAGSLYIEDEEGFLALLSENKTNP